MKKTLLLLLVAGSFSLGLLSCQGNTVGVGCTSDSECDRGQSCFTNGFPGGYCTKGCTHEGTTTECPNGTICARTSVLSSSTLFCGIWCKGDGECRGGQYTCAATAGSEQKACAP